LVIRAALFLEYTLHPETCPSSNTLFQESVFQQIVLLAIPFMSSLAKERKRRVSELLILAALAGPRLTRPCLLMIRASILLAVD
jgi:hypothetical protein